MQRHCIAAKKFSGIAEAAGLCARSDAQKTANVDSKHEIRAKRDMEFLSRQ